MRDQRPSTSENKGGFLRLDCHITDMILLTMPNGQEIEVCIKERSGNTIRFAIRAPKDVQILRLKG